MREIKFRAWDSFNGCYSYSDNFSSLSEFFTLFEFTQEGDNNPILEQFTGLHDKDGKEIYAGDILSNKWIAEVYCDKQTGAWMVKFHNNPKDNLPTTLFGYLNARKRAGNESRDCAIIGNIHQHPELITN